MSPSPPDLLQLDAALAELLDLTLAERRIRLAALAHADPAQAALLERLLTLADGGTTTDFRADPQVSGVRLVQTDADAPPQIPGYVVGARLGQGGMATVYAGRRLLGEVEQEVAIKVLRASLPGALDRARFLTEQQVLARLKHPGIATLLDLGLIDGRPYMVLERVDGVPLDAHLPPGTAPLPAIVAALEQICDALKLAHAHFVVHRDLKPANVLVTAEGRVKLIDFGIAKLLDDSGARREKTVDGTMPLTLRYASPEQLQGGAVGVTSDVWQLGLLAYWLCCGRWPVCVGSADTADGDWLAARLQPDLPLLPPSSRIDDRTRRRALCGDLDAIVLKCLAFDPGARYHDVAALKADLERHRTHQPVLARQQDRGYRLRRWLRRHRLAAVAAALSLVTVAVGVVGALRLAARNAEHAQRMDRVVATVTAMLTEADPYIRTPGSVTIDQVVAAAGDRLLAEETPADPRFQLRLLELLAGIEQRLRNADRERRLLQRAAELVVAAGEPAHHALALRAAALVAQARGGDLDGTLTGIAALKQQIGGAEPPLALLEAEAIVHSDRGDFDRANALLTQMAARLAGADPLARYDLTHERVNLLARANQLEAAMTLLKNSAALLDPAQRAHQPAWLRHRATEATLLGQLGQNVESARQLEALTRETRTRLGAAHPRVLELASNAGVMWMEAARPRLAWAAMTDIDAAALAAAPALSQASVRITRASAALYSGAAGQALPDLLAGLRIGLDTLGPQSPRLGYFLERTAWTLFELEQPTLAVPFAEHAWRLSGQTRSAADFLLQLISLRVPVPGRPDPGFDARQPGDCDRQDFALMAALWSPATHARPALTAVPADCLAIAGMRMKTLGLQWSPPAGVDPQPEMLDTPMLRRWLGQVPAEAPALALTAAQQAELTEAVRRLDAAAK